MDFPNVFERAETLTPSAKPNIQLRMGSTFEGEVLATQRRNVGNVTEHSQVYGLKTNPTSNHGRELGATTNYLLTMGNYQRLNVRRPTINTA